MFRWRYPTSSIRVNIVAEAQQGSMEKARAWLNEMLKAKLRHQPQRLELPNDKMNVPFRTKMIIDDILMTYWWHFDTISIQSDLQKAIITTSCRSSWIDPWYIQSQLLEYHLQLVITSGASAWASASTSNLSLFGAVSCMKMRTCSSQNHRRSPWYWVVMHV